MTELLTYVLRGLPIGCVFALMAVGLVLTYKTSGVLNLAFGAQAYVSACVFYLLRDAGHLGLNPVLSFVVAVLVVGPAIGLLLDVALYRHLRTAPPVAKLVTSLGLLVAIPQIVKLVPAIGSSPLLRPPGVATEDTFKVFSVDVSYNELTTILLTGLTVGALMLVFRSTSLGLQMRAVVESPRLTELAGVDSRRIAAVSWMLSSAFAGLAGVLLAPLFAQLSDINYFTLLVAALAAAAFGRLSSIGLTLVGGILLGVTQQLVAGYLPQGNVVSTGIRPSLPFIVLVLLLLFMPGLRQRRDAADPLAGVDPPPPAPVSTLRDPRVTKISWGLGAFVVVGGTALTFTALDDFYLAIVTKGVILAVVFLSITMITGIGGQLSLCQGTFCAVGCFATAQLALRTGMPVILALLVGAAIAAVVGALVALPALRLGGVYLALATLAFALMFENVVVPLEAVSGGNTSVRVPRPLLFGINFRDDRRFFLLCVVLLGIVAGIVILVRTGTTGRYLHALRTSETAAAAIGISPARAKITVFALSAAIAGFGGGLLAVFEKRTGQSFYQADMNYVLGLVWLVLVITLGSRSVQAAITAGLGFLLFPRLLENLPFLTSSSAQTVSFVLFGLGAITYAKFPEGVIESNSRRVMQKLLPSRSGGAGAGRGGSPAPAIDGSPA